MERECRSTLTSSRADRRSSSRRIRQWRLASERDQRLRHHRLLHLLPTAAAAQTSTAAPQPSNQPRRDCFRIDHTMTTGRGIPMSTRTYLRIMRKGMQWGSILLCLFAGHAWSGDIPRKPKVRALTAFVQIERSHYQEQVQQALVMLRLGKAAFENGGYEVQTLRITTQPFPQYTQGMSKPEVLAFFEAFDDLAQRESFIPNIGPAMLQDSEDSSQVE